MQKDEAIGVFSHGLPSQVSLLGKEVFYFLIICITHVFEDMFIFLRT